MLFSVKDIGETEVQIVQEWTSPKGERWVTIEYYHPEYKVKMCDSFKKSEVTGEPDEKKVSEIKKSTESILEEW